MGKWTLDLGSRCRVIVPGRCSRLYLLTCQLGCVSCTKPSWICHDRSDIDIQEAAMNSHGFCTRLTWQVNLRKDAFRNFRPRAIRAKQNTESLCTCGTCGVGIRFPLRCETKGLSIHKPGISKPGVDQTDILCTPRGETKKFSRRWLNPLEEVCQPLAFLAVDQRRQCGTFVQIIAGRWRSTRGARWRDAYPVAILTASRWPTSAMQPKAGTQWLVSVFKRADCLQRKDSPNVCLENRSTR